MAINKKLFERRMPAYLGGLLISLGAMLAIFQAKRAMMPTFHPVQEVRDAAKIAPGGGVRILYAEEPGYFLIPGLPTNAVVLRKQADGNFVPLLRFSYGDLVDKSAAIGPLPEVGSYRVDADFYICAQPGVADCTKLSVSQDLSVEANATQKESLWNIGLAKLAQTGLEQGARSLEKKEK